MQHVHLIPFDESGMVNGVDGRAWHCNSESILAHAAQYPAQFAGDYFHASIYADKTGAKAPASGWIDPASLVLEANGIWADVQWTDEAAQAIRDKAYKYISPVFSVNPQTQTIIKLKGFGLTHYPNLGDLTPVANAQEEKETPMDEVIERLRYLLNLPALATDADMASELDKVVTKLRSNIGSTETNTQQDMTLLQIADAIAAHQGKQAEAIEANASTGSATIDAGAFVPRTEFDRVQTDLNALIGERESNRVDVEVNAALEKGVIAPASLAWAKDYCKKDKQGFAQFVANSAQVVPLGEESNPSATGAGVLTDEETAVCSQLGLSTDDYLKSKAKEES